MAPQDWGLWMHAKYLGKVCPYKFSSTQDAYERLQQIKHIFANKGADFMVPCGKENNRDCHLLKHLSVWNDLLVAVNVRIKEAVATKELELYFPKTFYVEMQPRKRIERAVILLHLILIKHTCVAKIELEKLGEFSEPDWFALFCDGINDCRRLKTLRVSADIKDAPIYRQLLKSCNSLRRLEELSLENICDVGDARIMTILTTVIARNTKLMRFKVDGFDAVTQGKSILLLALQRSPCLYQLSLDVTTFSAEEANTLLRILNGKNGLKSLRLKGNGLNRYITVQSLASALSNATTLVELKLDGFFMHTYDAWILAMTLIRAQTVQNLVLDGCMPVFSSPVELTGVEANDSPGRISGRIEPYVHILKELTCLRRLALDLFRFPAQDQRAFLEALSGNDFLEHVFVAPPNRGYPNELSRIAIETGTATRIYSSPIVTHETNFASLPMGSNIEELIVEARAHVQRKEDLSVTAHFTDLRALDRVTDLYFCKIGGRIDVSTAKVLALYLQNTKSLRTVTLNVCAGREPSILLLDALSRNTGITSLGVERWCCNRWSAVALADIVRSSMIHTVTYNEKCLFPSRAFFSRLAGSIESNFTIVSVNTLERKEYAKNWEVIKSVAARNAALLERAAQFVTELSFDKSDAKALELVASSPLLPLRVQELAAVGECEAAAKVRRAIWNLRDLDVFMSITGVVKESVVCEESSDGRARLDALPADCWLAIRRYLSFTDVVGNASNG
ncbi:hypothetical protein HPB52_003066 [Rhipicephalus sanguineus]|uniref:Uncharacterized protein n=1 Tax=Rhipicephalus sanguineus TaxID=34632 RepID=A0A9D4PQA1_RHISA|nr:hypothetical protein HPB52_003066 [Rhipicephalus sanguineus]